MLYGMKKQICSRGPVACCHSPEVLDIKMLSFKGNLQKQFDMCIIHLKIV